VPRRCTVVGPSEPSVGIELKTAGKNITADSCRRKRPASSAAERNSRSNGKGGRVEGQREERKDEKLRERFTRCSTRNGFYCEPFIKPVYFVYAGALDEAIVARA